MKNNILFCTLFLFHTSLFAQSEHKNLKLSVQTDLAAYTTLGGWSLWGVAQLHQNNIALAYINYPNRNKDTYDETGIKEIDRFARLQLTRYFKPTSKLKQFFYGINAEYHWRELEEDNNPNEILDDTHWKLGAVIGYEWSPWNKKENTLNNLSIIPWLGLNYFPNQNVPVRVFENSGNVYGLTSTTVVDIPFGINISYSFFKK
ncbi:MAG: hypothetical protein AB8H03_09820 [Saprospiraceae bacterium]